jgi:hypothetical protein
MPVIALILSTLFFWAIYWFFRMGGLEHIQEARTQRRDAERKRKALESQRSAPIQAVDDPRDAAIEDSARRVFGFEHDLAERTTMPDLWQAAPKASSRRSVCSATLFRARLTDAERHELVDMVEAVAALDGPSEPQREAIDTLRRRFAPA